MKTTFVRLLTYATAYKRTLISAFLLLFLATGASVLGPYLIKVFIDDYLTPGHFDWPDIGALTALYVAAQLIAAGAFFMQAVRFNRIALDVIQRIRQQVFAHVMTLPMAYFDRTATGSLISRITNDTEAIKDLYVNVISVFAQNIVRVLGILIAMAFLDIRLMWICATLIPVVMTVMFLYQRLSTPIFQRVRSLLSDINARLNESIEGMSVIQLMNQQKAFGAAFRRTSTDHYRAKIRNIIVDGFLLRALVDFIYTLLLAALLFGFGWMELNATGAVQIGVIYAFMNYLGNITEPLIDMTSRLNMAQQALVSASRVFDLMAETSALTPDTAQVPASIDIEFDLQRFSYDGQKDVLTDIQFHVAPGEFVGIVGHTGSGKSTLMSLLMNFYPVEQGRVTIGGCDIGQLSKTDRTRLIGFVQQDAFIFSGTIADNIRLDLDLTMDEVIEASQKAQLHEAIMAMPNGYLTELTERGKNLSTGQRQLLSLARTLARRPEILILDETTANIDSHTEALIQQSLMALRGEVTLIAIAHRLSTVKDADKLLVLHQGHIQQQGRHAELMRVDGLYRHLYQLQQQKDPLTEAEA
ncbi:ABC transporter ATP-binding protein [Reinekea blandensis]|uniref:ABC-type multidrug transport system, ATPase and permease component n=1 Tax=Reinekea blandensis MED297 TaxID=314283 RepID=A4BHU5_9GAMM|nr:ABC transporter transmembrane domain-containing protein [Reinekea blandensis]EAR08350.1 ABC-type multidrug transport system, ATPase and permease component [Reinekea sp. MED297] [Reinekea blandensis MED297]